MTVFLAILILALFAIGLVAMLVDVACVCEEQELLDELWADEAEDGVAA